MIVGKAIARFPAAVGIALGLVSFTLAAGMTPGKAEAIRDQLNGKWKDHKGNTWT